MEIQPDARLQKVYLDTIINSTNMVDFTTMSINKIKYYPLCNAYEFRWQM